VSSDKAQIYNFGNKLSLAPISGSEISTANQMYATTQVFLTTAPSNWVGDLKLLPATDNWFDTVRVPGKDLAYDPTGQLDNWKSRADAWNTEVNPAIRYFIGDDPIVHGLESTGVTSSSVSKSTIATLNSAIISHQEVNSATGKVIDKSIKNTMRSRDIIIEAHGLKPSTRLYFYFDGMDVTNNVTQINLIYYTTRYVYEQMDKDGFVSVNNNVYTRVVVGTGGISSTAGGKFYGIFRVPAKTFNIGAREFKISNSPTFSDPIESSYAKCTFYTQGSSVNSTHSILNTRPTNRLSNKSLT
jgi:hypothetical protein